MTLEEVTTLKEAIKRLKEVIKEVRSTIQPFLYDNEAKDYILKALEQPKWIPVSERLPEKNMACLVAVGRFNLPQIAVYSDLMGTIDHKIFYQGDYGDGNFKNITQYVKAWMPLPEPYKAESEDNK